MKYKATIKREQSHARAWTLPSVSSFDVVKLLRFSLLSMLVMLFVGGAWTPSRAATVSYEKITSVDNLTNGEYLIVYETGKVAFNGGLTTLDATENTVAVEITNGKIASSDDVNSAFFLIEKRQDGHYTLKAGGEKYIGVSSNSNGLKQTDDQDAYPHDISFDADGNAIIAAVFDGSTMTLRYNKASNQLRFRYFKSGQEAIQLYKKVTTSGGGDDNPDTRTATTVALAEGYATTGEVGGRIELPQFTVTDANGSVLESATVTWESSNTEVATINAAENIISLIAAGTATIKATYAGDETNYKPSTISFTLTVNPQTITITSLYELQNLVTATSTPANITFRDIQVVYVNGNNAFLADANGYGALIYTKDHGLEAGQVLNGTIKANIALYQGNAEITDFTKEGLTISKAEVTPTVTTINAITKAQQSTLVTLKNVTFDGTTNKLISGNDSITFFDKFKTNVTLADGIKYNVTGIIIIYNGIIEIAPRTADDVVATEEIETRNITSITEFEDICYSGKSTICNYTFSNLLVTYQGANHTYVTDGNRAMMMFGPSGLMTGQRISGTIRGTASLYLGTPEFIIKQEDINVSVLSSNNDVAHTTITAAQLKENTKQYMSQYVSLENVRFETAYTTDDYFRYLEFKSDGKVFRLFNLFNRRWEINTNATYTLDGMVGFNKDTIEIAPMVVGDLKLIAIDEPAGFRNFNIELNKLLTNEDGSNVTFGLSVAEDGKVSRVAADAANAAAVITGKTGNDHGLQNFSATVKVEGAVKITMGTCSWGGDVTVKNAAGETVATFTTKKGEGGSGCYKGMGMSDENIVSAKYVGEATTLTISGGAYVNFFAVEKVEASSVEVSYSIDDIECEGNVLPAGGTYAAGDEYTIPAQNFTLYKEGYTLTGWSDGTNVYAAGEKITLPDENIILAPVFTKNEVNLADRTEPVTLKYNFRRDAGAPTVAYQNATGIWVAQATIGDKVIDVKADFDTNNDGKFANGNWTDWAQLNGGTKWTIPSCKGATVSMEAYSDITTTTIDGQSDYTQGKTISYEIAGTAESVDVVIGDGSYYRYIQVVLPVVQSQGGGEKYENVHAKVEWFMNDAANPGANYSEPDGVFATVAFDYGDAEITGISNITNENAQKETTGIKFKPSGTTKSLVWSVKPAAGLTFTPTRIAGYVNRCGTDAENGITVSARVGDGEPIVLGTWTALRSGKTNSTEGENKTSKAYDATAIYLYAIDLTADQQTALTSGETLFLESTIGVGAAKEGAFGEVVIDGLINGEKADIAMYTLTTAANPAEGGSVSTYPVSEQYEAGSEVTLTATENFGYDFVNWTNAAGDEVSTEAKFKYTVNANETLTANFKAVETYELSLTVDGTNDYMVTINPAPTMVEGKMMYEAGTTVELNANQYEGLVTFTNWSDGETTSKKLVKMEDNVTLTAAYAQADIIAGWDFYKKGGEGRKADFAGADNEADALSLVETATGNTSGWLDKSTEAAGGYESFKGAAVNWRTGSGNGDVGYWHWQTKVNAEAFTNITVQFQMLYNYNAYQKYNAEYSLDGENWTNFGNITMENAKAAASFNETLPEAANNQKDLFIRMIADKTSEVKGTASANDGNTLAMFFITGTPKLVDDPVAPALVSSVPANGATGASATGKIVLNFDKKVQVAEGAVATLGTMKLTPAVSGKVITFEYKGLEYSTEYTFNLPANTVQNLTGATLAEAITIKFTTMARPTITKGAYDAVVSNVEELVAAINAAESRADKNVRFRIFIKNGKYTIPLGTTTKTVNNYDVPECITFIKSGNISFIGESRDGVIITNGIQSSQTFEGQYGTTSKYDGIGNSDVFQISGSDYYFQDLTVETGMDDATGRDLAIHDKATRTIYKNTGLRGYQDTWTSNNDRGLYYFEGGYVRGRTDYMCGKGDAFFNGVELRQIAGGYAAVPSKPANIGWVYKDCVINGEGAVVKMVNGQPTQRATAEEADGKYTLGRPWGKGTPVAVFIDTKMNVVPSAIGWNEMSGGFPKRFAEWNSTTSTGSTIDLSGRKTAYDAYDEYNKETGAYVNRRTEYCNPVLSADEALEYSDMSLMFGEWQPTLATEQAPIPTNVQITGTTLTWDDSNYALLWAIVKGNKVIDFVTEPTYTIDDASAKYAVRAANEMGGLSEATEATVATGIEEITPATTTVDGKVYNLAGQRVNKATKGLYIINGKKVVVK